MPDYDNKNSFILFYETDKKSEKSPDLTGTLEDENGKKWRIAAWERTSQSGKQFLSGKVSEDQPREQQQATGPSGYDSFKNSRPGGAKPDVVAEVPDVMSDKDFLDSIPF